MGTCEETCGKGAAVCNQLQVEGLGRGACWSSLMGRKEGRMPAKIRDATSQVWPLVIEDWEVQGSGSPGACGLQGLCRWAAPPHASQHAWLKGLTLKGLSSPQWLTPKEEKAALTAGWHITLGHRDKRGAENSLSELCQWRPPYRHRNENGTQSLPDTEPAPWVLTVSLAPAAWPRSPGGDPGHLCW